MAKDSLARGARSATFFTGAGEKGEVELRNVSSEPKEELVFVPIVPKVTVQKITPLYDRVLIRRNDAEEVSAGGILLAKEGQDLPQEGTVVETGFGRLLDGKLVPLHVTRGARVMFGKYSGVEVKINGEVLVMMREEELLAVIE